MPFILILILLSSLSFSAEPAPWYSKEFSHFVKNEFYQKKNYRKDGKQDLLTKEFHARLLSDPKLMKLFFMQYAIHAFNKKYKNDKDFAQSIRKRFGKDLELQDFQKMGRMIASLAYSDTEANHRFALLDEFDRNSTEYFDELMKKLEGASFK